MKFNDVSGRAINFMLRALFKKLSRATRCVAKVERRLTISLTKTTAAQNDVALSYHRVRG